MKLKSALLIGSIMLLVGALISACGGGSSSSDNGGNGGGGGGGGSTSYSELLFVGDMATLKAVDASDSSFVDLSSATIPGIPGTYARSGSTITVTIPGHWLAAGDIVNLQFAAGTGGTATSGVYTVVSAPDSNTFTVTDTASGAITKGTMLRTTLSRKGTYVQSGTTITVTLTGYGKLPSRPRLDFTTGTAVSGTYNPTPVDANTFTVTATTAADTSGNVTVSDTNYTIFGIAMHPSGKWVYTTSTYENDWGGGLISRFAIDWSTGKLTFEKSFLVTDVGGNAPIGLTFSPDGTLLFNQDDDLDGIGMWRVDATTGDLTMLASLPGAYLHGLAVSSDGTRLYNGNASFSFDATSTPKSITQINAGNGGNSSTIVNNTLYDADDNGGWKIRAYSLTDPDVPAEIATVPTDTTNSAREIVVSGDGHLIVSAGLGGLKSFTFNGTDTIADAVGTGTTQYIDGSDAWATANPKMFRSITMNGAGNVVASAYFTTTKSYSRAPNGVMLFTLAADGSLAKVADYTDGRSCRAVRFFRKPE